jgi:hypothetical protein
MQMKARATKKLRVVRHEEYHGRKCQAMLRTHAASSSPPGPWNEACAYLTEAKCLFHLFKENCGWRSFDFRGAEECLRVAKGCL